MTIYPIIKNCNFEAGSVIDDARCAVDDGLVDDGPLLEALDELERVLTADAEDERPAAEERCAVAEAAVEAAWTAEVREAVHAARRSRYRD